MSLHNRAMGGGQYLGANQEKEQCCGMKVHDAGGGGGGRDHVAGEQFLRGCGDRGTGGWE